jgi:AcrR family transcriptional regulator
VEESHLPENGHSDARTVKGEARRGEIILAALHLLTESGVEALTLDAVARKAGVSKGGLVHHFNTKEALVHGVVNSATEALHEQIAAAYEASPDRSPGSFTRVYIETTLRHAEEGYLLALFELVARDPSTAAALAEHNKWCYARFENDGIDPVLAHVLASAADGLWIEIIFKIETAHSWRVRAMKECLMGLSRKPAT